MTTYVLGAGVVGVTTAYFLAQSRSDVVVIDAADTIGAAATNANAGMIAPSDAVAWPSPQAPLRMLKTFLHLSGDVRIGSAMVGRHIPWGLRFLRECTAQRHERNTVARLELALYSQKTMAELVQAENLQYDQSVGPGILYVYSDEVLLDGAAARARLLAEHGHRIDILTADAAIALEPALAPRREVLAGAVHGITDSTGDARLFATDLARRCEGLGVSFQMGVRAEALELHGNRITGVSTNRGRLQGDTFVLCLGSGSAALARTVGLRLPILPVKGYCADYVIRAEDKAPDISGVDEKHLVAWCRLGDRLRFTTGAEFGVGDQTIESRAIQPIRESINEFFPRSADYENGSIRTGLRPMTPGGPPLVGATRYDGLYLNTGHGSMGWTMACGTARAISDVIAGREPAVPTVQARG